VEKFANDLRKLPHPHKVVIAGNHDLSFENTPEKAREWLGDSCIYLQDSLVEVEGLKIYGSPWQPFFCNWAFNLKTREELKSKWDQIPEGIDILITHGPPHRTLDEVIRIYEDRTERVGCKELALAVERVKPRLHVFGHIHEGYGQLQRGETLFVNAASCTTAYRPINEPIVVELEVK
jgi:Icc-related predicted phosphoesterase